MKQLIAKVALLGLLAASCIGAVSASAAEAGKCCISGAPCCKPGAPCCNK